MTNDMDTQFLCKDCERYNLCKYYHGRKEKSYICKFFHIGQKSGKWINDKNDMPICSQCGYIPQYDRAIDDYEYSNFCPNCGAKMENEDKE